MIKRLILAVILIGLVGGGLVWFNRFRDAATEEFFATMQRPPIAVAAATVEPVTWTPSVPAFGTVSAVRGVDVASEIAGVVETVLFEANESVEAGQLLVQLADSVEQADLEAARVAVERDQQAFDRASVLSERGVTSSATLDDVQSALAVSRAQLERLAAVLDLKRIEAPFAGTIGIPRIEEGQYVATGTVVATLQDLDRMRVDFSVPSGQAVDLAMGQTVLVGLDDGSDGLEGRIVGIDPRADPQSRLVDVRAEIGEPAGRLLPGQFVRIQVLLPEDEGVIAVPQTAVVASLYGDFVYLVDPPEGEGAASTVRQVFVETGRRSNGEVEIVDGVAAGDTVVLSGQNRLSPGASVTIAESSLPDRQVASRDGGQ